MTSIRHHWHVNFTFLIPEVLWFSSPNSCVVTLGTCKSGEEKDLYWLTQDYFVVINPSIWMLNTRSANVKIPTKCVKSDFYV